MLLVGGKFSMFYNHSHYIGDSLRKANPGEYLASFTTIDGVETIIPPKQIAVFSTIPEQYFINRNTGHVNCISSILLTRYQYEETTKKINGTIEKETEKILDYTCQKATTHYGGRDWTVWFAPEIVIGEGPWLLRGLPGLILKAEDKDSHYIFECIGFERLKTKKPVIKNTKNEYRNVNKKDFFKEKKRYYNNSFSYLGITFTNGNISLATKFNPIELEE
jgi:GLPGLI family protein